MSPIDLTFYKSTDIKVVDGLAAIKNEKELEGLKDAKVRKFIDTAIGYELVAKAESLKNVLNSINYILRSNGFIILGT